jgi:hypothetical protein
MKLTKQKPAVILRPGWEHRCTCRFSSGNVAEIRFKIPAPGCRVRFLVSTSRSMSKADFADCDTWLESVRQTASRTAARGLTLRTFDTRIPVGVA